MIWLVSLATGMVLGGAGACLAMWLNERRQTRSDARRMDARMKTFRDAIDRAFASAEPPADYDCPCPTCTERRKAAEAKN